MHNETTISSTSSSEDESLQQQSHRPCHPTGGSTGILSEAGMMMMTDRVTTPTTVGIESVGDNIDHRSSNGSDGNNNDSNNNQFGIATTMSSSKILSTKSSFFLLNKENHRGISQVQLTLENITYRPVTSTPRAKLQRITQSHSVWNRPWTNKRNKRDSGDGDVALSPSKGGKERTIVLDKVNTEINPFQLTAWMGPSGSGKTSLTSVVAGLVDPNDVEGTMKVNGEVGRIPKQMVGVVWQDDLLLSNLTVEETIYFAARLKTPGDTPDEQVQELTEETMNELGLIHVRDHLIGSSTSNMAGISGGERKRVAVAAELVVRPSLLLLDEPTSGLDATTAYSLVSTLKDLATLGHSIAVVIHQPRTDIFKMIDHLLLLSKGKVIYNGTADCARKYLETIPEVVALPPETGIADWIMDTVIADEQRAKADDSTSANTGTGSVLATRWVDHPTKVLDASSPCCALEEINAVGSMPIRHNHDHGTDTLNKRMSTLTELQQAPRRYESSFWKQLKLLTSRTVKQQRGEKLTRVTILLTFSYVFFTSFFWWRMPDNTAWVFERNSLLFFMMVAQGNGIVVGSIAVFQRERALLRRERAKKMYGVLPFFIAKASSDMTNNILLPVCYGMITYWTAGLRPSFVHFVKFILAYYLTLTSAQSMGFFLSILIPNSGIAMILAPPITLFFFIIGGFYIPLINMHVGIKWASYLSFARYGYSALLVNEFQDRDIPCSDDDASISIGGTGQCPLPGDDVYESVGITGIFANFWFNVVVMCLLQVSFLIGAYSLLRRSK